MRGKNIKYILVVVALLALAFGAGRLSAAGPLAPGGALDSPGPPESTYWYTLEDIYDRLYDGTAGAPSIFTEPVSGPTAGTGHTLNEIMAIAPALDNTDGTTQTHVLAGRTAWGLTSGQWGPITGTMPDNGAVRLVPATTQQTIAAGYHNGSGYVEGDADLVAGNIKGGANVFGVDGTLYAPVPKTGAGDLDGYTEQVGEDGHVNMRRGVAWPTPRFITSTAGIVTDTLTGLIWLQNANCTSFFPGDSGPNIRNWSNALTAANSLASGYCGLSDGSSAGDWRLPNVRELQSLAHYGFYGPAVPNTAGTGKWTSGDPFTGVQSFYYWSSTTYAGITSDAWYVHMYRGTVSSSGKEVYTYYVWPVRGGQ